MSSMPKLPVEVMVSGCDENEARIVRACFNGRNGCLKASKPFGRIDFDGDTDEALFKASANYVWRMLCFDYAGFGKHVCMPVTADLDVSAVYYEKYGRPRFDDPAKESERADRKARIKYLDLLIKRAESTLPVTLQAGVIRWGRALGVLQ